MKQKTKGVNSVRSKFAPASRLFTARQQSNPPPLQSRSDAIANGATLNIIFTNLEPTPFLPPRVSAGDASIAIIRRNQRVTSQLCVRACVCGAFRVGECLWMRCKRRNRRICVLFTF